MCEVVNVCVLQKHILSYWVFFNPSFMVPIRKKVSITFTSTNPQKLTCWQMKFSVEFQIVELSGHGIMTVILPPLLLSFSCQYCIYYI